MVPMGTKQKYGCLAALASVAEFVAIFTILAWMFEYVLYSCLAKDAPFILDGVAGLILNGVILVMWVACMIARAIGYAPPFFS